MATTKRSKTKTTARQEIQRYLNLHPNRTAWQIAQGIKRSPGLVSSILNRDIKAGKISVSRSKGPRGGRSINGYKK